MIRDKKVGGDERFEFDAQTWNEQFRFKFFSTRTKETASNDSKIEFILFKKKWISLESALKVYRLSKCISIR